jgi:hypothetical protein
MPTPFHRAAAAALALFASATPLAAQALAYGEPPPIRSRLPALADHYRVRLTSAWPQLRVSAGCVNGGTESVEGTLTRTATGGYAGSFARTTHLLFCGAHGNGGAACSLTLDGDGAVLMQGTVLLDERSPSGRALRVAWTPDSSHGAEVSGECGAEFKEKVERMYLSVRHGAEFALPNAGAARRTARLEEFAWTVEVE